MSSRIKKKQEKIFGMLILLAIVMAFMIGLFITKLAIYPLGEYIKVDIYGLEIGSGSIGYYETYAGAYYPKTWDKVRYTSKPSGASAWDIKQEGENIFVDFDPDGQYVGLPDVKAVISIAGYETKDVIINDKGEQVVDCYVIIKMSIEASYWGDYIRTYGIEKSGKYVNSYLLLSFETTYTLEEYWLGGEALTPEYRTPYDRQHGVVKVDIDAIAPGESGVERVKLLRFRVNLGTKIIPSYTITTTYRESGLTTTISKWFIVTYTTTYSKVIVISSGTVVSAYTVTQPITRTEVKPTTVIVTKPTTIEITKIITEKEKEIITVVLTTNGQITTETRTKTEMIEITNMMFIAVIVITVVLFTSLAWYYYSITRRGRKR